MTHKRLLKIGITGTVVTAICCFTPVLVWILGAVGLSAWAAGFDFVLLLALALFLAVTALALWRMKRE